MRFFARETSRAFAPVPRASRSVFAYIVYIFLAQSSSFKARLVGKSSLKHFVKDRSSHLKQVSVITQVLWVIILRIFCVNQLLTHNAKQLREEHSLYMKKQLLDKNSNYYFIILQLLVSFN